MSEDLFPTPEQLCLEEPLYRSLKVPAGNPLVTLTLERFKGPLRTYCLECEGPSVFNLVESNFAGMKRPTVYANTVPVDETPAARKNRTFGLEFRCAASSAHRLLFLFTFKEGHLQKVGQFPSTADLANPGIVRFRSVLPKDLFGSYKRAFGLRAHGIGIGAFVYLRRIIEHLLEEAHSIARAEEEGWDEEGYQKSRVTERIKALRGHLPEFMVENAGVYSILSRGVHELSEDECLQHFPVLAAAIDLILDDLLAAKRREENQKAASKALNGISAQLGEK